MAIVSGEIGEMLITQQIRNTTHEHEILAKSKQIHHTSTKRRCKAPEKPCTIIQFYTILYIDKMMTKWSYRGMGSEVAHPQSWMAWHWVLASELWFRSFECETRQTMENPWWICKNGLPFEMVILTMEIPRSIVKLVLSWLDICWHHFWIRGSPGPSHSGPKRIFDAAQPLPNLFRFAGPLRRHRPWHGELGIKISAHLKDLGTSEHCPKYQFADHHRVFHYLIYKLIAKHSGNPYKPYHQKMTWHKWGEYLSYTWSLNLSRTSSIKRFAWTEKVEFSKKN